MKNAGNKEDGTLHSLAWVRMTLDELLASYYVCLSRLVRRPGGKDRTKFEANSRAVCAIPGEVIATLVGTGNP